MRTRSIPCEILHTLTLSRLDAEVSSPCECERQYGKVSILIFRVAMGRFLSGPVQCSCNSFKNCGTSSFNGARQRKINGVNVNAVAHELMKQCTSYINFIVAFKQQLVGVCAISFLKYCKRQKPSSAIIGTSTRESLHQCQIFSYKEVFDILWLLNINIKQIELLAFCVIRRESLNKSCL